MKTERERIADQISRSYRGEAWHGPSIAELLSDVGAAAASARPEPSAQRVGDSPEPIATGVGSPSHERDDAPTQQEEPSAQRVGGGAPTQQEKSTHTIWELVLHTTTWERYAMKRLQAGPGPRSLGEGGPNEKHEPSAEENFPTVTDTSEAAWKKTLEELELTTDRLCAMIRELASDARLDDKVPGKDYNVYFLLHGIAQHNIYHAGQIALLKKK